MLFLVILILAFVLQMFLPWWIIIVISFAACGIIGKTGKLSLWSPFFAILLLWTALALYKSMPNEHLLANRVAQVFSLRSWWQILIITSVLGAFAAAISGFCGYHFRKAILAMKSKE